MRWKNGRGTTYEVATSPDGSGTADFDWRISFADVDTDGPFSSFVGIDRVIVVVEGQQMVLTIDGRRYALEPHQPLGFAGESFTTCQLPAGPTRDLNVMTRRGRVLASVEVRTLAPGGVFPAEMADLLVLVALTGDLAITSSDGEQSSLERHDVLQSLGGATLTVKGPGTVAVVRLTADPRAPSTQLTKNGRGGVMSRASVEIGIGPVAPEQVVAVAREDAAVTIDPDALEAIQQSRAAVERLAEASVPAYGVSTGFGALATKHIAPELRTQLQKSLVRSHAAGNGPEVEREVVRAMMLLRLSTLATGHTGIRPETAQTMAAMLTHGITPIVHEHGSLGCSGDLAPLAHCALAVMGEGTVRDATGKLCPAAEALADVGLRPVELAAKEGLALINGTDGMLGMLILAQADLAELLKVADIAAAMSVEALLGTDRVFAEDLQALRPHPGQVASAANLRRILAGSAIVASHRGPDCTVVQDAYSLRCSRRSPGRPATRWTTPA